MKRNFAYYQIALFMLIGTMGCQNDEQISPLIPTAQLEIVKGNQQTAHLGEFLQDTLVLRVIPRDTTPVDNFLISYKMTQGNGFVQETGFSSILHPDQDGIVEVRWSLGCDYLQQKITFYLYSDTCSYLDFKDYRCVPMDSVTVDATAKQPKGWSKACGFNPSSLLSASFTSYQEKIYAVVHGRIYYSQDEGINWNELPNPSTYNNGVRFIECNKQGHLYILTENDGVFYSIDQGTNWIEINTGILDHRYPLDLIVEDDYLFVSFYFDGLYRSTDKGKFWQKLLIEGKYHEQYSYLTRHPNGNLYVFDKWSSLFKSSDNGNIWQRQEISHNYIGVEANDMAVDQAGNLVITSGYEGLVSVLSPETLTGNAVSFYSPETHSTCAVYQITTFQDKLFFIVVGNLKPGVYFGNQGDYTYAHPDFDRRIAAYFIKPDGSLLLATEEGLYYYAE